MAFHITRSPIDADSVKQDVLGPGNGAVLVFHGAVRNKTADRQVTHLEYEAYEPMALAALKAIGQEVVAQHGLSAIACTHRIGRLEIGEDAMVVAVSSPHRAAALAAVETFIVRLKQDVPIWKKEHFQGGAVWVGTPRTSARRPHVLAAGALRMTPAQPVIVVISDSTGETAEQAGKAALAQFGLHDEGVVRTFPNILTLRALEKTIIRAKKEGALVVYTLVGLELRSNIKKFAETYDVTAVDLIGGLIRGLAAHIGRPPLSVPGLSHELSEEYFRRIAAVEFSITNDDGKNPQNLTKADLVLVGISRASKTPLSNYIAGRGYKVANVPIVMDLPLPEQLYQVDPARVFALTINPAILMKIRKARLLSLRMQPDNDYGDLGQIRREVIYAQRLYAKQPEWSVIDMSTKAVEEAASLIIALYRRRFPTGEDSDPTAHTGKKKTAKKKAAKKRTAKKKAVKKKTAKRKVKK